MCLICRRNRSEHFPSLEQEEDGPAMIEPDLIHAANATSAVSVAIDDIEVQLNTNQSKVD